MEYVVLTATQHAASCKKFTHDCDAHALVEQNILADSKMKLNSVGQVYGVNFSTRNTVPKFNSTGGNPCAPP